MQPEEDPSSITPHNSRSQKENANDANTQLQKSDGLILDTLLNVADNTHNDNHDKNNINNGKKLEHEFVISSYPRNNFTLTDLGEKIMGRLTENEFLRFCYILG